MKLHIHRVVALTALIGATACRIERTPRPDSGDPVSVARDEIELTLQNYREALVAGDARRVASIFTTTARVYLPDQAEIMGRGPIDDVMARSFADGDVIEMDMDLDQIDVGGGVANQFGRFTQLVRDADGEDRLVNGRFAIRWIRASDSAWRIERLLVNHAGDDGDAGDEGDAGGDGEDQTP